MALYEASSNIVCLSLLESSFDFLCILNSDISFEFSLIDNLITLESGSNITLSSDLKITSLRYDCGYTYDYLDGYLYGELQGGFLKLIIIKELDSSIETVTSNSTEYNCYKIVTLNIDSKLNVISNMQKIIELSSLSIPLTMLTSANSYMKNKKIFESSIAVMRKYINCEVMI